MKKYVISIDLVVVVVLEVVLVARSVGRFRRSSIDRRRSWLKKLVEALVAGPPLFPPTYYQVTALHCIVGIKNRKTHQHTHATHSTSI